MVNGQWSMVSGQWLMVNGQWSMVSGQWLMVNGQWLMVNGQWLVVRLFKCRLVILACAGIYNVTGANLLDLCHSCGPRYGSPRSRR